MEAACACAKLGATHSSHPPALPPSRGYREKGLYKSLIKHKDHIQEPSGDHAIDRLTGEGGGGRGKVQAFNCACDKDIRTL